MANYLAGISNLASAVSGSFGRSSSGAISTGLSALTSVLGGGFGAGSKPKALHTEHASGQANWLKPYGSNTDIVFYLVRADAGAQGMGLGGEILELNGGNSLFGNEAFSSTIGANIADGFEAVGPTFGAAAQTGGSFLGSVQSPLSQVGTFNAMGKIADVRGVTQGLAGPLSGLGVDAESPLGKLSQTFAKSNSTFDSVMNITQSVGSLQSLRLSNESSEAFFTGVLKQSFDPGSAIGGTVKTADEIRSSIKNGSISDLSTALSVASGGVTTAKQLIEGINKGEIGFTGQSSGAESKRLGPQGASRERLMK